MKPIASAVDATTVADSTGLCASIACAIHCAAMPLVIGYLPMLGLSWLADPAFHRVMAMVCFALALSAFLPGWRRHRSLAPTLFGSAGVALLSIAAFAFEGECCPACTAAKPPPTPQAGCSDSECPHCTEEPTPAEPAIASTPSPLAWTIPFMTPVGGVLLIAGHLSNHRRSCSCCDAGCCSGGPDDSLT